MEFYNKGYIEWPRWFMVEYWPDMSDGERILFQTYLSFAEWRGEERGWCLYPDSYIAAFNRWGRTKHMTYKKLLKRRGLIVTKKGKSGVFIPRYHEIVDYKIGGAEIESVRPYEQAGANLSAQTNEGCSPEQTGVVRIDEQVGGVNSINSDRLQPPNNIRSIKNKRQEAKRCQDLNLHQSQNPSNLSTDQIEQIQETWAKHWHEYPPILLEDIQLLISKPLTELDSIEQRLEFLQEAICQADQRRRQTGDNPDDPKKWIYSGLHKGNRWLQMRTRDVLAEKRESRILAGNRGNDAELKNWKVILAPLIDKFTN